MTDKIAKKVYDAKSTGRKKEEGHGAHEREELRITSTKDMLKENKREQ